MGYNVCDLPEEGFKNGFGPTGVLDLPEERVRVEWYSKEKELFSPASAALGISADKAVMCFTEGFYPKLTKCLGLSGAKAVPSLGGCQKGRMNKDLLLLKLDIGAPAASMVMEVVIASGVRRMLMLGLAGSLSPSCPVGSHMIPTWGIREEGTSYHYIPSGTVPKPSPRLVRELEKGLAGLEPRLGGVWSTDAPYRETPRKIREYASRGVLAVDMETTAMMAVAMRRKAEFAAVLTISDLLHGEEWAPAFGTKRLRTGRDALCEKVAHMMV